MIHKKEDGCDKGAHQSYLGTERNTPVIPNWFQLSKVSGYSKQENVQRQEAIAVKGRD